MASEEIQHPHPVWRDKANFILAADLTEEGERSQWEQMWARHVGDNRYQLCCIPFFTYDLALGDIVDTETEGEGQYVIRNVLEPSGHDTFRVWFGDSAEGDAHQDGGIHHRVLGDLTALGTLTEWSSHNYLAVDAASEISQRVAEYLSRLERQGVLQYEFGMTRSRAVHTPPLPNE